MDAQNEIKRTLKQQTSIEAIRGLLEQQEHHSRSSVAESVCQHFGFFDARQRSQTAGCVKALRELERAGHIVLPAALDRGGASAKSPRRLGEAVEAARDVPDQVNDVRGLRLRPKTRTRGTRSCGKVNRSCNRCAKDSPCETGLRMIRTLTGKGQS